MKNAYRHPDPWLPGLAGHNPNWLWCTVHNCARSRLTHSRHASDARISTVHHLLIKKRQSVAPQWRRAIFVVAIVWPVGWELLSTSTWRRVMAVGEWNPFQLYPTIQVGGIAAAEPIWAAQATTLRANTLVAWRTQWIVQAESKYSTARERSEGVCTLFHVYLIQSSTFIPCCVFISMLPETGEQKFYDS